MTGTQSLLVLLGFLDEKATSVSNFETSEIKCLVTRVTTRNISSRAERVEAVVPEFTIFEMESNLSFQAMRVLLSKRTHFSSTGVAKSTYVDTRNMIVNSTTLLIAPIRNNWALLDCVILKK